LTAKASVCNTHWVSVKQTIESNRRDADVTSVDVEKRTFEVLWSTGAPVLRSSYWDGQFYEELSMEPDAVDLERLNSGRAPFLWNHDGWSATTVLGVVEAGSARIENGQGFARIRYAPRGMDEVADLIFDKISAHIIRNVSVGYQTYKTEKIEGTENKIPTLRAVAWAPYEISAVSMGADADAAIRSMFAKQGRQMENVKPSDSKASVPDAPVLDSKAIAADAVRVERERVAAINNAVRAAKLPSAVGEKLIADGVSANKARAQILEALAERTDAENVGNSPIVVGETDREKWLRGATAAMVFRSGLLRDTKRLAEHPSLAVRAAFKDADTGEAFRNYSLLDLAREALERADSSARSAGKLSASDLLKRVSGGAVITDFPVLLENVMYKMMLGAYALQADTWRRFCKTDTVSDFRPSNRYRVGSFGPLDAITEDGEYKSKSIPDGQKFTVNVKTYGNIIGISRQTLINDDLGAVADTASKFGRAAALSIEVAVYALLNQNLGLGPSITVGGRTAPLFDATAWKNVSTGSAISMAGIEADRVLLAQQTDWSGNEFLNLRPAVMLVPLGLEGEANAINRAKFDPTAASALERPNIVGGLFREVIGSPRLSGTRRYLFVDPGEAPALVVTFLNGVEAPYMENRMGFAVDGIEWKARLDFNASAVDPKGAVTNAGV